MLKKLLKKALQFSGSSRRKYRSSRYSSSRRSYGRYSSSGHRRSPFQGSGRYKKKGFFRSS